MVAGTPPSCRRACVRVALRQEVRSVLPIPRPAPERERIGLPRQAADHAGIGDLVRTPSRRSGATGPANCGRRRSGSRWRCTGATL
jgi:hypothetical protein